MASLQRKVCEPKQAPLTDTSLALAHEVKQISSQTAAKIGYEIDEVGICGRSTKVAIQFNTVAGGKSPDERLDEIGPIRLLSLVPNFHHYVKCFSNLIHNKVFTRVINSTPNK